MKNTLTILLVLIVSYSFGQSISQLKSAINDSNRSIQAIHEYPASVNEGKSHWVEVTKFEVNGSSIKIIETWTNLLDATSTTTLTGKLANGIAKGKWNSSYSSGSWEYDFNRGRGKWNKTESFSDTFGWHDLILQIKKGSAYDGWKSY